jgi:hypothetical protein
VPAMGAGSSSPESWLSGPLNAWAATR